jgi:hypothetical protein
MLFKYPCTLSVGALVKVQLLCEPGTMYLGVGNLTKEKGCLCTLNLSLVCEHEKYVENRTISSPMRA